MQKTYTDRQTHTTTTVYLWGSAHRGIINSTYGVDASVLVQMSTEQHRQHACIATISNICRHHVLVLVGSQLGRPSSETST